MPTTFKLKQPLPMDQQDFNTRYEKLTPRQKEILFPFLKGEDDQAISNKLHCTTGNVRQHLSKTFHVFGLSYAPRERCRDRLVELFFKHKPQLVDEVRAESAGQLPQIRDLVPDFPGSPVALQSSFYLPSGFESRCCEEVTMPGQLLRIRAPQMMGKTSLLYRILDHAGQRRYNTVLGNLRHDLGSNDLSSFAAFLAWFCQMIAEKLEFPLEEVPITKSACTRFFQVQVLPKLDAPLVIALDETEVLFEYPEIARDFFALLRGWHEKAKAPVVGEIWAKLRLVVVHSTDDYIQLATAQSPFTNVGYVVRLSKLQATQILSLAHLYGLKGFTMIEVERLMRMVNGHPFLVQQAFYALWRREIEFDQLLASAPTFTGIYRSHLQELFTKLKAIKQSNLPDALAQVMTDGSGQHLNEEQIFKLEGLGLIEMQGNQPRMSCELYRRFFQNWL